MSKITVAIVEDNLEVSQSLELLLNSTDEFVCVGTCANSTIALNTLPDLNPNVILMDINLPDESGIECIKKLKPQLKNSQIVMLTMYEDSEKVFEALASGAIGYLLKRTTKEKLLAAIKEAFEGGSPMSMQIARMVVKSFANVPKKNEVKAALTEREWEILEHLAKGKRYKEIAASLFIGVETVRSHLRNIYEKLQVRSSTEAVLKYLNNK
ncbi:MAG: response regulator transcription factor [Ignavibacteria bacterium]|nr:response regulator transcription factor [Ignavibacteria bacterium]